VPKNKYKKEYILQASKRRSVIEEEEHNKKKNQNLFHQKNQNTNPTNIPK